MRALDYFNISQRAFLRALMLVTLLEKKRFSGQENLEISLSHGLKLESPKQVVGSKEVLNIWNPLNFV